jgi:hypothetical protein
MFSVFNIKGGVGKTAIATNLALSMGYQLFTNDEFGVVDRHIKNVIKIRFGEAFPKNLNRDSRFVLDLGGFIDRSVKDALIKSSVILIPITFDQPTVEATLLKLVPAILPYNQNLIFIVNRAKKGEYENLLVKVHNYCEKKNLNSYPVFEIKESVSVGRILSVKKSVAEQMNENGLNRRHYAIVKAQFDHLIDHIKLHYESSIQTVDTSQVEVA